jgi:hypothetical protein
MPVSVAKSSIWTIDVAVLGKRVAESPMPRTKTTGSPQLLLVYAQDVAEYAGTGAKGGAAAACVPDAMQETIVAAVVATPAPRTQDVVQDATVAVEATTAAAPAAHHNAAQNVVAAWARIAGCLRPGCQHWLCFTRHRRSW